MRKMLQKEKMKERIEVANSPEARFLAMPMPPMRLASSPTVKRRKNLVGRLMSRPHMAASAAASMRVEMRITAMERTMDRAAVVKLVTIRAWVTVARPCLSRMGMISWKIVSVMIGVARGISPAKRLHTRMVR